MAASLLLAGCAGSAPASSDPAPPAPGAPTAPVPCLSQSDDGLFVVCLRTELDQVWSREFRDTGRGYTSPGLTVGRAADTGGERGRERGRDRASFNSRSGIRFPTSYLDDVHATHGSRAHIVLAFTLGHEVGHHVQYSIHPRMDAPSVDVETQADCYAGFWARREADAHQLQIDEFRAGAQAELRRLSSDPDEVNDHGTAEQRIASLEKGLGAAGPSACDVGRLTWR
jgi:hypothetical protein